MESEPRRAEDSDQEDRGGGDKDQKILEEVVQGDAGSSELGGLGSRSNAADPGEGNRRDAEAKHLLNIFPEEVWHLIFDAMEPRDLQNVSNACLFFRELLLPKRVLFLFPDVWEVLAVKYEKDLDPVYMEYQMTDKDYNYVEDLDFNEASYDSDFEEYKSRNWTQAEIMKLTRRSNGPWFRTILKFRLVCRAWCTVVEEFYQNLPSRYKMKHDDPGINIEQPERQIGSWTQVKFSLRAYYCTHFQWVDHYFEYSHGCSGDNTGKNPFLARSITFDSSRTSNYYRDHDPAINQRYLAQVERFWNQKTTFLSKYGHHIWHCVLEDHDCRIDIAALHLRLGEWLALMPNLKVLEIRYPRRNLVDASDISVNPLLPKIPSLEFIKTSGLPVAILNQLIGQNCHVSMLEVERVFYGGEDATYDLYSVPMSNLRQLSVEIMTAEEVGRLESLEVIWPLEKFYLGMSLAPYEELATIVPILQGKWASSLRNVMIQFPYVREDLVDVRTVEEFLALRLELPLVQRLKLQICTYTPLDCILPMKDSLEFLDISFYDTEYQLKEYRERGVFPEDFEEKRIIKGIDEWRNWKGNEDSNIWTLFPKLKRIYLGYYRDYFRTMWREDAN